MTTLFEKANAITNLESLITADYKSVFTHYIFTKQDPAKRIVCKNYMYNFFGCGAIERPSDEKTRDSAGAWIMFKDHVYVHVDPAPSVQAYETLGIKDKFFLDNLKWFKRTEIKEAKAIETNHTWSPKVYPIGVYWTHGGVTAVSTEDMLILSRDFDESILEALGFRKEEFWIPCSMGEALLDVSSEVHGLNIRERLTYTYKKGGFI